MGKFEKPKPTRASKAAKAANADNSGKFRRQEAKPKKKSRLPLYLGIGAAVLLIAVCVVGAIALKSGMEDVKFEQEHIVKNVHVAGVNIGGMTREEAVEALRAQFPAVDTTGMDAATAEALKNTVTFGEHMKNMDIKLYGSDPVLSLFTTTYDPANDIETDMYGQPIENVEDPSEADTQPKEETEAESEEENTSEEENASEGETEAVADPDAPLDKNGEPYVLDRTICLPASNVEIRFDLQAVVEEAYQCGRSATDSEEEPERIDADISRLLTIIDNGYIDDVLTHLAEELSVGSNTEIKESTTLVYDEDNNPFEADCLEITLGGIGRSFDMEALKNEILRSYMTGSFELNYIYEETIPEPIDLDALYEQYECVAPINAVCDKETYEISESKNGYGFLMSDAYKLLSGAKTGDTVILTLTEIEPERSTQTLQESLFSDVLATYDSPHVWNPTRTRNLELACEAIDGTILHPGQLFSFNDIVGERTAEKGYGAAAVYVGGKTEDQLGGGVCQVASTIYWCTLKADLEVVERAEHMFTPSYVPWGMDATIYWGSLDYQFRNNTDYPIRIDASVSDGYVHITFVGTETKDYTVNLFYEIASSDYSTTKVVYIHPEMEDYASYADYEDGETIQSAYDGHVVYTYLQKRDANDDIISTERIEVSEYDRRDKEIAKILDPTIPMDEQVDSDGNLITYEPDYEPDEEPTEEPTEETDPFESFYPLETEPTESTDPSESTEPTESTDEPSEEPTEDSEDEPSEESSEEPSDEPTEANSEESEETSEENSIDAPVED